MFRTHNIYVYASRPGIQSIPSRAPRESQLKPLPPDLYQIRKTKVMDCFGVISPGVCPGDSSSNTSHTSCVEHRSRLCRLAKLWPLVFRPCDMAAKNAAFHQEGSDLGEFKLVFDALNRVVRCSWRVKVSKRRDNLTGGDRFSALFIMLQWAYPVITLC